MPGSLSGAPKVIAMSNWTAEVGNDPHTDFDLVIELLKDGEYRARVRRDESWQLVLEVYEGAGVIIPADRSRERIAGGR